MQRLVQVEAEQYVQAMRQEAEGIFKQVMEAVNAAPDGALIDASEHPVHDLMEKLRRTAYQRALQMRVEQSEAAFSPSDRSGHGAAAGEQGQKQAEPDECQRGGGTGPSPLWRHGHERGAGGSAD